MKKSKNKFDKYFLWSWKRFVISVLVFVMVFFFRNQIIRPFLEPLRMYNPVFYIISIGIPVYLLLSFVYTIIIKKVKFKKSTPQAYPEKSSKKIFTRGKNKFDKWFLLSWKKVGIILISWVGAVVIHNMIYAFFIGVLGIEFEEAVFFIIANVVIPIYFIICVVYSMIRLIKRK
jgi:hypothetical protein